MANATVITKVSHIASLTIGDSATLQAAGTLDVESLSSATASANSGVVSGGGVAVATNTTTLDYGTASTPAATTTAVASNAVLKGRTGTVGATISGLNLTDTATEEADGVGQVLTGPVP